MNKANLKSYAPQARKDFIAAVTARANRLGLSGKGGVFDEATSQPEGHVTVIAGQAWPIKVEAKREQLIKRIKKDGFDQTLEAIASTWFNRFAALRYMELHDYLGHGHRVLSGTVGGVPDILTHALSCMVHMGNGVMGIAFGTAATVFLNRHIHDYVGNFSYCDNNDLNESNIPVQFPIENNRLRKIKPDDFKKIPGSPVAYWVSNNSTKPFEWKKTLSDSCEIIQGMITGNNANLVRAWQEVSSDAFSVFSKKRDYWVPYNKGGEARKWYGNHELIVDWRKSGNNFTRNRSTNSHLYFQEYVAWSYLNSGSTAARLYPAGFLWDVHGSGAFPTTTNETILVTALLCSKVGQFYLGCGQ